MVILAALIIFRISMHDEADQDHLASFIGAELLFAIMISHNILSLTIYGKCYPDQEIPKVVSVLYRISEVGCWLCLLIILGGLILVLFDSDQKFTIGIYTITSIGFILIVLFVIQIIGGRRLVNTIKRNIRKQLENSFV